MITAKEKADAVRQAVTAKDEGIKAEIVRLADKAVRASRGTLASVKIDYGWSSMALALAVREIKAAGYNVDRDGDYLAIRWNHA